MEKKRPILSIRPHFDPGLAMVQSLIVTAGGFIVVTIIGGILAYFLLSLILPSKFVKLSYVLQFFALVSIAGIPPLFYEIKKRALQRTLYNFHVDYLDFQFFHFYLNRRRGRLWYRDIADITQHASALQEHQRLTTIYLYAPVMAGSYGHRGFPGLKLEDLPQAKGHLSKIMDVVDMGLTGNIPAWVRDLPGMDLPPVMQAPPPPPPPPQQPQPAVANPGPASPPPVMEPAPAAAPAEEPQKT